MSDGKQPSARWMTCTTSHSPPLAEWTVDSVSQSSSSAGRAGQVAGGLRRVEGEVGEQGGPRAVPAGRGLDLDEVLEAGLGAVVAMSDDRFEQQRAAARPGAPARARRPGSRPARRAARRATLGRRRVRRAPRRAAGRAGRRPPASAWARTPRAFDEAGGRGRPDAVEQAEGAGPGQLVPRVVEQPQQRQQVLHVGGLEEAQPAVLHVRHVAAGELELEQVGVPGGPEQHGLAGAGRRPRRGGRAPRRRPPLAWAASS